jgi:hypothetical protein
VLAELQSRVATLSIRAADELAQSFGTEKSTAGKCFFHRHLQRAYARHVAREIGPRPGPVGSRPLPVPHRTRRQRCIHQRTIGEPRHWYADDLTRAPDPAIRCTMRAVALSAIAAPGVTSPPRSRRRRSCNLPRSARKRRAVPSGVRRQNEPRAAHAVECIFGFSELIHNQLFGSIRASYLEYATSMRPAITCSM